MKMQARTSQDIAKKSEPMIEDRTDEKKQRLLSQTIDDAKDSSDEDSVLEIKESTTDFKGYQAPKNRWTEIGQSNRQSNLLENSGKLRTSSTLSNTSVVCINSIPMVNLLDLRRRSHNLRKVRSGEIDDLEYAVVPDEQIQEHDLLSIEKEVNKKKRKRRKDQKNGEMLSPTSVVRSSLSQRTEQVNAAQEQDDQDELLNQNMMVEQLFQNQDDQIMNAGPRRERSICCGMFKKRSNGHLDILCIKDLSQDFLYMLIFVTCITTGLFLYSFYV